MSSMWRLELLHPLSAHFPIVLTFVGTLFWFLGACGGRWPRLQAFWPASAVLLVLAALSAWWAVKTGLWADEVVGRELFDPRPLKDHENGAFTLTWLLTGGVVLDLGRRASAVPSWGRRWGGWVVAVMLLASCGLMGYVAHLGAGLVFQQGAGVMLPPDMN
ncbi:MAG: hypothetical protein WD627_03685 [Actinomycetota bacterium]